MLIILMRQKASQLYKITHSAINHYFKLKVHSHTLLFVNYIFFFNDLAFLDYFGCQEVQKSLEIISGKSYS